jgi:acyl-coenzyme A thioesterase PaaI-like protein
MHVTDLPINHLLGIRLAPVGSEHILELPDAPLLRNHLGTIHVTAQFALAEAASGEFLLAALGPRQDEVVGVLRRAEIKCSRPANGDLRAWARFETSDEAASFAAMWHHRRTNINVRVEIRDATNTLTMRTTHGWFLQLR